MTNTLAGKVALITGSGRGIGKEIALHMAREAAKIIVNDPGVNLDGSEGSDLPAESVVNEIQQLGGIATPNFGNVADFTDAKTMVEQAVDEFGKLDIVVTCAGILRDRMIFNMTEEEWDAVVGTHLKGTFNVLRHACTHFRQERSGRIITFSSESGLMGNPGQSNYSAAKEGILGLTRTVSQEMNRYGVTCNSIIPRASTRLITSVPSPNGERKGVTNAWDLERLPANAVAPIATYLAGPFAGAINGRSFLVYGNTISVMSEPTPKQTMTKDGHELWGIDEIHSRISKELNI